MKPKEVKECIKNMEAWLGREKSKENERFLRFQTFMMVLLFISCMHVTTLRPYLRSGLLVQYRPLGFIADSWKQTPWFYSWCEDSKSASETISRKKKFHGFCSTERTSDDEAGCKTCKSFTTSPLPFYRLAEPVSLSTDDDLAPSFGALYWDPRGFGRAPCSKMRRCLSSWATVSRMNCLKASFVAGGSRVTSKTLFCIIFNIII